jgi:gamma-glutamylcyclotransferase (GGCT)/AIG2-like uncharacterized protein YtfP
MDTAPDYEHWLNERLPIFVYGTLRPGQSNFHRLGSVDTTEPAYGTNIAIYDTGVNPWPHAVECAGATVRGDLIWVSRTVDITAVLAGLDAYEEFDHARPETSEYARVRAEFTSGVTGQKTTAWVYLARGTVRDDLAKLVPLKCGDWTRNHHSGCCTS